MFYLRLERKYKKSSVFSGKATKKHFAASLINYKQALGGGGGGGDDQNAQYISLTKRERARTI